MLKVKPAEARGDLAGLVSRLFLGFFINPVLYRTLARETGKPAGSAACRRMVAEEETLTAYTQFRLHGKI